MRVKSLGPFYAIIPFYIFENYFLFLITVQSYKKFSMLPNLKFKQLTPPQIFFIERSLELLFPRTLDSYRARLHNPLSALSELFQMLNDWHDNKLKQFETVKHVILETLKYLEIEEELIFEKVEKKYYMKLLSQASKDNYLQLAYSTRLLVETNKLYCEILFTKIRESINSCPEGDLNNTYEHLANLDRLTGYLITELVNKGYTKKYLFRFLKYQFSEKQPFINTFATIQSLATRNKENFTIIFKIKVPPVLKAKLNSHSPSLLEEDKEGLKELNEAAQLFFTDKHDDQYYSFSIDGYDPISVVKDAREQLSSILDLIHLGYSESNLILEHKALVIGTNNPSRAKVQPVHFEIDGYYKSSDELYFNCLDKLSKIETNKYIGSETKQKIKSAIRYLRLGGAAIEIEQKFINYWIGLEYIFSNYDAQSSTFQRLKDNLSNAHALVYIKRNLKEFHEDIKRVKVKYTIAGFSDDLMYLTDAKTYTEIETKSYSHAPLLAFRARNLRVSLIENPCKSALLINKHKENMQWHLARAYRFRNEIVHDAALKNNTEVITGNIRYYLTFILNSLLEYFINSPINTNLDNQLTIDDFFILQELEFSSLQSLGFPLNSLMKVDNHVEIFA